MRTCREFIARYAYPYMVPGGSDELSQTCRKLIENPDNTNFVSIASFWEIAIKLSIGNKLELSVPFEQLSQLSWQNNISILPIQVAHTIIISSLPFYHKDPFDRVIIAQAISEERIILSRDGHFVRIQFGQFGSLQ